MNSLPTILNECEFTQWERTYMPEYMTLFAMERSDFDYEPDLIEVVDEAFECSLMDEGTYAPIRCITLFIALMYPFTKYHSWYKLINKVYLYLFIFDDHMESDFNAIRRDPTRGREMFSQLWRLTEKLERPDEYMSMVNWKPYCLAYYAVNEDVFRDYNDALRHRMIHCIREYIRGNLFEYGAIEKGLHLLTVDEFLFRRRRSGAALMAIHLVEYASGTYVTPEEWDQPLMQALIKVTGNVLVYHNEIYSFEREFLVQDKRIEKTWNLVTLIALRHGVTVAVAMAEATALTAIEESKACNIIVKIMDEPGVSGDVSRFINYMNPLIGGSYKAQALVDRYNKI